MLDWCWCGCWGRLDDKVALAGANGRVRFDGRAGLAGGPICTEGVVRLSFFSKNGRANSERTSTGGWEDWVRHVWSDARERGATGVNIGQDRI